jgi:hypothetical protein
MTLKQRRRHGELMARFDKMKRDPYLMPPEGYTAGESPEEDEKYRSTIEAFNALVEEIHVLEVAAGEGD